jgi:ABC-type branched-subunit amino acid transport system substrate-binding protein/DNA-binding beta-propeller fold protein YncE/predicted Ser/Thr protein kinase
MKAAFTPGTTFANYRVESLLGRGGMGVVYLARDLSLDRPVALKLIAPELADDEQFRARFLREPRLAASLDHSNVIPIYEAGEHEGQLYLAMRFVEGSDLKTLLEREGTLSPERTLAILSQVAGALDAAHRRALVHRDIKPANVLLDEDEHVYLTDFGITKQLGGASTDTGRLVGTLDYLAPEQIRGDPVDGRTDCYSLACVLYECLAGKPPFHRATEAETMWAHMQDEPPPLRGRARLDAVLRKALAKDREHRYGRCSELIEAAAGALGLAAPRTAARAARRRARRPGVLLVAGGLLLLVAAGGAAIAALGGGEDEEPAPQRNGVAAIDGGGTQLASFTQTETPPSSLAVGEGAVWVLGLEDSTLSRIDPETKKVVKRFRLRHAPTDIAAGAGAVWVKGDGTLVRIDPDTGKATRTVKLPETVENGDLPFQNWGFPQVAVGAGAVWAINGDRTVSRIDPDTGRRVARIVVDAATIAAGREGVWFISADDTRAVTRIDPSTNRVGRRIPVSAQNLSAVAVGAGHVWATAAGDGVVWQIDPGSPPVARDIEVGVGTRFLSFGAGAIWTANYIDGTVSRIDVKTGDVESSSVRAVQSLAAGEGSAWVSSAAATSAYEMPQTCGEVLSGPGKPDVLIASDLPLRAGEIGPAPRAMADAIENVLERHDFRAGRFSVGYRSCDDSNEQLDFFDGRICAANANAYADARKLVAVIGTYNSDCAEIEVPILNSAPGAPLAMISPANTAPGLTRRGFERPPWGYKGQPGIYYPTGTRNYVRLPPLDGDQGPAYALLAKQLGLRSVYVLDGSELHRGILIRPFRYAARKLGIRVAGAAVVEQEAKDYDGLAQQIARSGAQGVVLGVDPDPARPIIRAIRARLGARFPIMASNYFVYARDVLKFIGPAAQGIYVATTDVTRGQLKPTPAAKQFLEDFGEDGSGGPILESAQATELVLRAIARSDGTRESVLEKLKASRVKDGILGSFHFDRNGDLTPAKMPIIRITGSTPPSSRLPKSMQGAVIDRVVEIPRRLIR